MKELKKLIFGARYRFKRDFYVGAPPLSWHAKRREIAIFEGKSLGYAHLRGSGGRLILMSKKEAFSFLEEVEE